MTLNMTAPDANLLSQILSALQGLRYGAVEITVHDGRVMQIERKEKFRFDEPPLTAPAPPRPLRR